MKLQKPFPSPYPTFSGPFGRGLLLFLTIGFLMSNTLFETPAASAAAPYGIQGHAAPELNLSDWIDGNGRKTDAIRLSDYRGKVVYLYFFQDW